METDKHWRRCSTCKKSITLGSMYWVCSVSTCNRKRSGMVFCSTTCWDVHVPVMNHREAWCSEKKAPLVSDSGPAQGVSASSKSNTVLKPNTSHLSREGSSTSFSGSSASRHASVDLSSTLDEDEILVVASKVKDYIREKSGFNTSASALSALSSFVRRESDRAIENAKKEERLTVLGRDILTRREMAESAARSTSSASSTDYKKSGVVIRRRE